MKPDVAQAVCAEALQGVVSSEQLAQHHESAAHHEQAAHLFTATATAIVGADANSAVASLLQRALVCMQHCEGGKASMLELEAVTRFKLIKTFCMNDVAELDKCLARFLELRASGYGKDMSQTGRPRILLVLGSWGKTMRDAVRSKDRWEGRRTPAQDPRTACATPKERCWGEEGGGSPSKKPGFGAQRLAPAVV